MNHLPKISIVTPCFNAAPYLRQMLDSIVQQNYPNLEWIVMDGGSTDGTVDILKEYASHFAFWVSEKDKGQSDAINKGIARCTGQLFNWMNADDYVLPGTFQHIASIYNAQQSHVICTATEFLYPDGSTQVNPPTRINATVSELLNVRGLNQMGMYWNTERIKQLKGVNPAFRYSMDLDLWKRYLIQYGTEGIISDPMVTAVFRLHQDSKTGTDLTVNFGAFDKENNAALWNYALAVSPKYAEGIAFLFPEMHPEKEKYAPLHPLENHPMHQWLNQLFYQKGQAFFYKNQFKQAKFILKRIQPEFLTAEQKRNRQSYLRWSVLKSLW